MRTSTSTISIGGRANDLRKRTDKSVLQTHNYCNFRRSAAPQRRFAVYKQKQNETLEYTPEQYKAAYQTLRGLDTHVAFERISQKSELELIQRLSFGEDISQENCNAEELLKSYKTKSYLEFTDDIYSEIELTDRIYEEDRRLRKLRQLP
ncbi:MAG: hypothetical protein ACLTD2_07995 [Ruminococcus sp.]